MSVYYMNSEGETIIYSPLEDGKDFFIEDQWGEKYHFKILSFECPSGLLSTSIQVIEKNSMNEPRIYEVLSDFDEDVEKAELLLKAKIKKNINRKHLIIDDGKAEFYDEHLLRGRIEGANSFPVSTKDKIFVVDGKRITIEQFINLIQPCEGFNFKFEIIDPSDDVD